MSNEGPKPYPVVYDALTGALEYSFQSGYIAINDGSNAILALTGDVTATGPGTVPATVHSASGNFLVNGAVQPSIVSQEVIKQAASDMALSIVGVSADGSSSTDGFGIYLAHNGTGNRQLSFTDTGTTDGGAQPTITFVLTASEAIIEALSADGSTADVLYLGTSAKGVQINGPLIQPVVAVAGTGTVTPTAAQKTISIPVSGNVTLNGPTGGYDGQALTIRVVNDGSHSVTLATGSGNYSFGTTITSYTNSTSTIDYIGVIYNSSASRWHVVSLSQGF